MFSIPASGTSGAISPLRILVLILLAHVVLALRFGSIGLDVDEFVFVREPYEMLGGDYTKGYLRDGDLRSAISVASRAYWFYWTYRPLNSPMIDPRHQQLFAPEEDRFGYTPPEKIDRLDPRAADKYESRLIVPEPDRMYSHGAGKPLLPAVLTAPSLGLVALVLQSPSELLQIQFSHDYHPIFILVRLSQILAGLATIALVYWFVHGFAQAEPALWAAALTAVFPISVMYFPNIHHDSIMTPFLVLSAGLILRRRVALAGLSFGLALASKNVAMLTAPAMLLLLLAALRGTPNRRLPRIILYAGMALLGLLPFANPVSYAAELLTPLIGREFDPRGEDVSRYTLTEDEDVESSDESRAQVRPSWKLTTALLGMKSTVWLAAVLGMAISWRLCEHPGQRWAWLVLLMLFPAGAVFSHAFNYRALMFVPAFAVLGGTMTTRRVAWSLVVGLWILSASAALDPMTVTTYHTPVFHSSPTNATSGLE